LLSNRSAASDLGRKLDIEPVGRKRPLTEAVGRKRVLVRASLGAKCVLLISRKLDIEPVGRK